MGISLAPDQTTVPETDPNAPPKPKLGLAPNLTAAGTSTTAPLPTEYPNAPSTTGQPQNRLQLATTAFDTFAKSTAPQYTADLREATQKAAGAGNLGSGMLRTTYGNLANQRSLALDTERSNLINQATTATIADQQAERGLGIQQQNADTSRIGTTGGLGIQQQGADTARIAALGGLDVAKGTLGLEQEKAATAASQGQQSIDLAKQQQETQAAIATAGLTGVLNGTETLAAKQAALQNAVAQGQLTVEQGKLALEQVTQQTSAGQTQQQIDLAKTAQAAQSDQAKAALALQEKLGLAGLSLDQQKVSIAQQQQAAEEAYQTGQISLAQRNAALQELTQAQNYGVEQQKLGLATSAQDVASKVALGQLSIAQAQQALDDKVKTGELTLDQAKLALDQINSAAQNKVSQQNADTNTGQLQLQKDALAQSGQQFGLSLAQQKDLATIADKTQNRQIDVATAQGQNALLLELARIMGTSTTSIDPNFLKAIGAALGVGTPTQGTPVVGSGSTANPLAPGTTPWPTPAPGYGG